MSECFHNAPHNLSVVVLNFFARTKVMHWIMIIIHGARILTSNKSNACTV